MKDPRIWGLKKSPWVYHLAAASCNNCDIEILELLTPRYDVERFGIVLVGSPRHADALLVTGVINRKSLPRVLAKSHDPRLVSGAFWAQANLLTGSLLSTLTPFGERMKALHDRSGQA